MTGEPRTNEVVYRPTEEFVVGSNVFEFMQAHGTEDFEKLHRRSVESIEGEPDSGLDWFGMRSSSTSAWSSTKSTTPSATTATARSSPNGTSAAS